MKTNWFIAHRSLFIVLVLAVFLRLWNLANVPPHLTPDEASLGYNAYSILKTGRDEYGEFMPIIFKSFGDYKPGLYVYTTVPFVALMGLSEWSVRLPSAISGVIAVWLLYKIIELHVKDENKKYFSLLPAASAFFLAVAPWHIHFSRGAWEINLSLTLTLAGIYFFFRSFKNVYFLLFSSLCFALTLLAYQGAKLSTPLVLVSLALTFFYQTKNLFYRSFKIVIFSLILGFILILPILLSFSRGQTGRLLTFSIFSYQNNVMGVTDSINGRDKENMFFIYHSKSLDYVEEVLNHWLNHYSARFLFFEGDWQNPKHSTPYHGVLTIFDLLLLLGGIYFFVKNTKNRFVLFIMLWFLLAPLPAALSKDPIHAVRAYNMVVPLTVVLGMGAIWILDYIRGLKLYKIRISLYALLLAFYLLSYTYFLDMYFVHLAKHNTAIWDYGLKQVAQTIIPMQDRFRLIKVQQSFAQPYIYFLFFGASLNPQLYDPAEYQKIAMLSKSEFKNDVGLVTRLQNIEFTAINWPENRGEHGVLFAGDEVRIPPTDSMDLNEFVIHNDIFFPDGRRAYRVVEVK